MILFSFSSSRHNSAEKNFSLIALGSRKQHSTHFVPHRTPRARCRIQNENQRELNRKKESEFSRRSQIRKSISRAQILISSEIWKQSNYLEFVACRGTEHDKRDARHYTTRDLPFAVGRGLSVFFGKRYVRGTSLGGWHKRRSYDDSIAWERLFQVERVARNKIVMKNTCKRGKRFDCISALNISRQGRSWSRVTTRAASETPNRC